MRNEILRSKLKSLLGRLSPPQSIRNSVELQSEEMASLASAVMGAAPRNNVEDWWVCFEAALLDSMTTRAWPTRNEIHKAASKVQSSHEVTEDDVFRRDLDRARSGLGASRKAPHGIRDWRITRALLQEGRFTDEREARFYGWPLSDDDNAKAKAQRMGPEEWRHHISVLGNITGEPAAVVEARERAELSPDQLPAGMVQEAAE